MWRWGGGRARRWQWGWGGTGRWRWGWRGAWVGQWGRARRWRWRWGRACCQRVASGDHCSRQQSQLDGDQGELEHAASPALAGGGQGRAGPTLGPGHDSCTRQHRVNNPGAGPHGTMVEHGLQLSGHTDPQGPHQPASPSPGASATPRATDCKPPKSRHAASARPGARPGHWQGSMPSPLRGLQAPAAA